MTSSKATRRWAHRLRAAFGPRGTTGESGGILNGCRWPRVVLELQGPNLARCRLRGQPPKKYAVPGGEAAAQYTQRPASVQLDLDVHAGRQIELHERIDRLVGGVQDVHQALV